MMRLLDEPGTACLSTPARFALFHQLRRQDRHMNVNADAWALRVQFDGHESGVRISTFQPQFNQRGTPGFGKFYTYTDTANMTAKADRLPLGDGNHGSWFFVHRGHLPDRPWFIEKIPSFS